MTSRSSLGAAGNDATRRGLRKWSRGILERTVLSLVAVYGADTIVLRVRPPAILGVPLVLIVALGTMGLFVQIGSYYRLSLVRALLRRNDWVEVSGYVTFGGPRRSVGFAGLQRPGATQEVARRLTPRYLATSLPLHKNVELWMAGDPNKKMCVVSAVDGGSPVAAVKPGLFTSVAKKSLRKGGL